MCLYLVHVFFAHTKLVVSQQEGPDVLSDVVLHSTVVNQPEEFQLLIVLHQKEKKKKVLGIEIYFGAK